MVSVGLCIDFLQNLNLEKLSRGSPFVQEFAAGLIPCACSSACPHPLDPPLAHRHPFYSECRWRAKHLSSRWAPTLPCRCRNLYDVSVIKFCNLMPCSTVFISNLNVSNFIGQRLLEWFMGIWMWGVSKNFYKEKSKYQHVLISLDDWGLIENIIGIMMLRSTCQRHFL